MIGLCALQAVLPYGTVSVAGETAPLAGAIGSAQTTVPTAEGLAGVVTASAPPEL
jgi:hypothetical protein